MKEHWRTRLIIGEKLGDIIYFLAQMKIPLIKSTFYKEKETKQALCDFIMKAPKLSMGEQCASFEQKFSLWQGKKYCVMFNSGSSANLALIQALLNLSILSKGDYVGFSSITWATNVMPLIQNSLIPIPIDVEISSLNISPDTLSNTLAHTNIKALFLTNVLGFSDDIVAIRKLCSEKNILLLEDNCESLGSEYNGVKLGNYGFASTFSFFVGHHMSTIEGGAVCTDDDHVNSELLKVRSHGWDRQLEKTERFEIRKKHGIKEINAGYTFYDLAYNIRPTEINGFLGNNQLQYLDETVKKRQKNFEELKPIYSNPVFEKTSPKMTLNSNFAFPIICKKANKKKEYLSKALESQIEARPILSGIMTNQPFFKKYFPNHEAKLPNSQYISDNGFYFGNNPELTNEDVELLLKTFY